VNDLTDQQLLTDYVRRQSEPAFAELVRRHVDLVYSAALRMVCDAHLAKDVSQGVFLALAKSGPQLAGRPVLSGWLHKTAQNLAANVVRTETRRRDREQEAVAMNELLSIQSEAPWEAIAPHLDAALGELNDADRDALMLRYFEKKSAAEMAALLGISDEAAQKRVSRAVDRLREYFTKRNVTIGAGGLVVLISANAVQAAPVGLITAISGTVLSTGTALATSTATAISKTIAMTALQKTFVAVTVAAIAGAGIYETRQAAQLRQQVQALQQQQLPLSEQIQQLQAARDDAAKRSSTLADEMAKRKDNAQELAKLRAEVARLQGDSRELAELKAAEANDPASGEIKSWLERVHKLKQLAQANPALQIPEFQLLTEDDWLKAAKLYGQRPQFDADTDFRVAMSEVRQAAQNNFASLAQQALQRYAQNNNGAFPDDLSQLASYFVPPVDSTLLNSILARYTRVPADSVGMKTDGQDWVIESRQLVDEQYDHYITIGPATWGYKQSQAEQLSPELLAAKAVLDPVVQQYSAANGGQQPTDPSQLQPYATTPDQQAALQKFIQLRHPTATQTNN
jgi:RNA polymerase sigma factor (sigma-70 family)